MEILKITEKEDGSADLTIEFTEEEVRLLLQKAIVDIMQEYIKEKEKE